MVRGKYAGFLVRHSLFDFEDFQRVNYHILINPIKSNKDRFTITNGCLSNYKYIQVK